MDNTQKLKQSLVAFNKKYPHVMVIGSDFQGSGDSFEDFYNLDYEYYPSVFEQKEPEQEESFDLLYQIINMSDADFNNDGSDGDIVIDFARGTYECNVNFIEYKKEYYDSSGFSDSFELDEMTKKLE
jgi:hypothetical protein